MDHRKTSNESVEPAVMTSPLGSTAKHENCTGDGEVNVRKLRYRIRSNARTVPSREAENNTWPCEANWTADTEAVCWENVMTQNPDRVFHNLTLPSSPPVAIYCPSGEYASAFTSKK